MSDDIAILRHIPRDRARVQIIDYIDNHQGCLTSDIIYDLELDPDLVLSVLRELAKEGNIRGMASNWSKKERRGS